VACCLNLNVAAGKKPAMGMGSHEGLSGGYREAANDAADDALIRDLATEMTKREMSTACISILIGSPMRSRKR